MMTVNRQGDHARPSQVSSMDDGPQNETLAAAAETAEPAGKPVAKGRTRDPEATKARILLAAKREFATDRPIKTLQEAVVGADVFLGLSVANVLTKEMVRSMNADPIVFALANPNPEISYADAMASRDDIIFATGRSDYPNQINNVLGFPYIFRGALAVKDDDSEAVGIIRSLLAGEENARLRAAHWLHERGLKV